MRPGLFALCSALAAFAGCAGKSTTTVDDNEGGASYDEGSGGRSGSGGIGGRGGTAGGSAGRGGTAGTAGTTGGRGGTAGTSGGSAGAPEAGRGGFAGGGTGPVAGASGFAGAAGFAGASGAGASGFAGAAGFAGASGAAGTTGMDPCNPSPCENGAACMVSNGRYLCECPAGFEGMRCELNVDECLAMPCLNGGTCVDATNAYRCECLEGFEGSDCGINHDDCLPNPCQNGATCSDQVSGFACACTPGWEGPLCDVPITTCTGENPCQHGGLCQQFDGGYRCDCDRYTGTNCETPKVLLIHDGAPDLVATILRTDSMDVTVTEVETQYDASPTPPGGFCAVVHLNGTTYATPMPLQGQQALRAYVVNEGGGFVSTAWNGYEAAAMTAMSELMLVPYVSGHEGLETYQLTAAGSSHPVTAGLPSTFTFSAGFSEGRCPATSSVLATEVNHQDAVCVADVGAGRVVDFNHAGFYQYANQYRTWEDPYVQRLLVQGVNWACRR